MKELTPIHKLDEVLKILASNYGKAGIDFDSLYNKTKNIIVDDGNELQEILEKLFDDNFIIVFDRNSNVIKDIGAKESTLVRFTFYKIKFEGRYFLKQGGYTIQEKSEGLKKQEIIDGKALRIRNDSRLIFGTYLVAAVGLGLIIWEMIKTFLIDNHYK